MLLSWYSACDLALDQNLGALQPQQRISAGRYTQLCTFVQVNDRMAPRCSSDWWISVGAYVCALSVTNLVQRCSPVLAATADAVLLAAGATLVELVVVLVGEGGGGALGDGDGEARLPAASATTCCRERSAEDIDREARRTHESRRSWTCRKHKDYSRLCAVRTNNARPATSPQLKITKTRCIQSQGRMDPTKNEPRNR